MSDITNKEILLKLYDKVDIIHDTAITNSQHLKEIDRKATVTNGAIAKAQKDIAELERNMTEQDHQTFRRLIKIGGVTLILCAFVFIKESRDVIIAILTNLFL